MRRPARRIHDSRGWLVGTAIAVALLVGGAARAEPAAPAWPTTRAGELAQGWVEAFDAGEPAMLKFQHENSAASALAKKSDEARRESYRKLREMVGPLTLASVVDEEPDQLTVMLADSQGTEHEFEFEIEHDAPRKLLGVTGHIVQQHHGFLH